MWHSTLELNAREQQAHASSYQRYDDQLDDTFSPDDDLYSQEQEERPYQGWSAPEEKGYHSRQENQYQEENQDEEEGEQQQGQYEDTGEQYGYQSGGGGGRHMSRGGRSGGRTNFGFNEEEED